MSRHVDNAVSVFIQKLHYSTPAELGGLIETYRFYIFNKPAPDFYRKDYITYTQFGF